MFTNPLTEVYLLFHQSVLLVFNHFNLFLQRDGPCIHLVHDHCQSFLKKVLGKFVQTEVIEAARSLSEVNIYIDSQLSDHHIFTGFLQHAKFVDFDKRQSCHFSDISYFMDRYQIVLGFSSNISDRVFDEFVEYQLLDHDDIPQSLWEMAEERMKGSDSIFVRMDVLWGYLGLVKTGDGCELKFQHLPRMGIHSHVHRRGSVTRILRKFSTFLTHGCVARSVRILVIPICTWLLAPGFGRSR